jgi:hypothetical protein
VHSYHRALCRLHHHAAQSFTGGDTRNAALATSNLGVEFIQSRQIALNLDTEPGLIRPFLIGCQLLASLRDRVMDAMEASLEELETSPRLQTFAWLRQEARIGIRDLRRAVDQYQYAEVRDAATFLSGESRSPTSRLRLPLGYSRCGLIISLGQFPVGSCRSTRPAACPVNLPAWIAATPFTHNSSTPCDNRLGCK